MYDIYSSDPKYNPQVMCYYYNTNNNSSVTESGHKRKNLDFYEINNNCIQTMQSRKRQRRHCTVINKNNNNSCNNSNSRHSISRRVSFGDESNNVSYSDHYSQCDRKNLCYTRGELKAFTKDSSDTILSLKQQQQQQQQSYYQNQCDEQQLCIRGLERYMIPRTQRKRRHLYIKSIVNAQQHLKTKKQQQQHHHHTLEQPQNHNNNSQAEYLLAMFCWTLSQEHVMQAKNRATQDEQFVQYNL